MPGTAFFLFFLVLGLIWGFFLSPQPELDAATRQRDLRFLYLIHIPYALVTSLVIYRCLKTGKFATLTLGKFLFTCLAAFITGIVLVQIS
ncbi:hypothetical protein [Planctomicrobium sp. SH664]|uniref:hypothetical protein n=1 Tax=Planctomicrobium sp. SH664 TaxID=3448125 RepID=UPI003F5B6927